MGLRSMSWDSWIELDNQFPKYHARKRERILERGDKCVHTAPEALPGAIELLDELCAYLTERYPTLYQQTPTGIQNLSTGETFDITSRPLPENPMQIIARLIQDDTAIMFEKPDGQYYLLAGAIHLAGFWRLQDKLGLPLSAIHTSGDVPQYREKLERGMMSFFRRLRPETPMVRNNYFIQVDDDLAWSGSIGGEDEDGVGWDRAQRDRVVEMHFLRSERQSLRRYGLFFFFQHEGIANWSRLPKSGGIVFTIHTYFVPVVEIAKEPYVPGRLAAAVRSWGDDVARYKGRERYGDVLLAYLDGMHAEQVAGGLDLDKEGEGGGYPF